VDKSIKQWLLTHCAAFMGLQWRLLGLYITGDTSTIRWFSVGHWT